MKIGFKQFLGLVKLSLFCLSLFCLSKKVTKKGPPKTITARFRDCSLIKHLYYCKLKIGTLITNTLLGAKFYNHVNLIIL